MPNPFGPPGCPYDPGNAGIARPIDVRTVTLHRTIGRWGGDYSVGKNRDHNSGTFQWLIGQDEGQWVQFYPANSFCSHAAGSNEAGPGIEITGQNGEPLTDWQITALGQILRWLRDEWHVIQTYTDGDPRVYVDTQGPLGFVSHRHVGYPPNPRYHHYDYITDDEFARALGGAAPNPQEDDVVIVTGQSVYGFPIAAVHSGGRVGPVFDGPANPDYGMPQSALDWNQQPGRGLRFVYLDPVRLADAVQ